MLFLIAALAVLAAGPLLSEGPRGRSDFGPVLDGLVMAGIPGLIFLEFVPSAMGRGEWSVLLALAAGLALPIAFERTTRRAGGMIHRWALLAGLTGIAIHAALDGAALATLSPDAPLSLPLAAVLHRLPVGAAVWWLVAREMDRRAAIGALIFLMAATVLGYGFGREAASAAAGAGGVRLFQAAVGGSLVHVVMHQREAVRGPLDRRREGWGAVVAAVFLLTYFVVRMDAQMDGAGGFLHRLYVLSAESAPALLLAYLCAGLLSAFLPQRSVRWMERGGGLSQAGRGMAIGLPFPICSCGVVPLYRSLIQRGAPPAAAMAFLVATPELGVDAIMLSIPLLGPQVTVLRLVTAALVALLVGWWVGGRLKAAERAPESVSAPGEGPGTSRRLAAALRTGTGEVVDHTAPWILLGLGVAALVTPFLESGWLGSPAAGGRCPSLRPAWVSDLCMRGLGYAPGRGVPRHRPVSRGRDRLSYHRTGHQHLHPGSAEQPAREARRHLLRRRHDDACDHGRGRGQHRLRRLAGSFSGGPHGGVAQLPPAGLPATARRPLPPLGRPPWTAQFCGRTQGRVGVGALRNVKITFP